MKMQGRLTRLLCLALITVLLAGFLPGVARAAEAVSYLEGSWDEATNTVTTVTKSVTEYTKITSDMTGWSTGWYVAEGEVTIDSTVTVTGDVHLILCDDAALTANSSIIVNSGNSLTVYAQSMLTGMGKLKAIGYSGGAYGIYKDWKYAGIGSEYEKTAGTITIHGGTIEAEGSYEGGAAIGGGRRGDNGTVNIYGGTVTATGKYRSAGIGGGSSGDGGVVNIYGGTVTATGGEYGAGIGGGMQGAGGTVTISGGTVTATGGKHAAGIGGGYEGAGGNVTISGGTVTATGGEYGAGIGGGLEGAGGTVTISGGTVTAAGGEYGAGIGGGYKGAGGSVTISDGTVTATGGKYGAGIGGGWIGSGASVTISGGTVTVTGGYWGAGIGGGYEGAGGTVTISGGTVTATGDKYGAGIGGGYEGADSGTVTISGGTVTATGGEDGAGIGGGKYGAGGSVTISGGSVKAIAGKNGQSIGRGQAGESDGTLTDGSGNAVSLQTLTLDGVAADTPVTALAGAAYGMNDVKTLDTNKVYVYLPEGTTVASVTAGGTEYPCNKNNTFYQTHSGFDSNGICVNGCYEPAALNAEGWYEIDNTGKLFWLAQQSNRGAIAAGNVMLTADITIPSDMVWTPMGINHTIDGQGHTLTIQQDISGTESSANYGLFTNHGYTTVKNLILKGSIKANTSGYVGVIVGSAFADTFENVISYVDVTNLGTGATGGLAGYYGGKTNAIIRNCAVYADISGKGDVGGLIGRGWGGTQYYRFYNCAYKGSLTDGTSIGALVGYNATGNGSSNPPVSMGNIRFESCYFCPQSADISMVGSSYLYNGNSLESYAKIVNTAYKSEEAFASGEAAYLLGAAWGQTIGEDALPILGGAKVSYGYTTCAAEQAEPVYTNDAVTAEKPEHIPNADDGDCTTDILCSVCGDVTTEGLESHTPDTDDGDCTTPIQCTLCEKMAVEAKTHNFLYGECDNEGCNVWQTFTMTYYVDGEEAFSEVYTCGSAYWLRTPDAKEGKTFLGWAEKNGGEVKYAVGSYVWPDSDMEFHAVYGTVHTVTYYAYDAEQNDYYDNGTATVPAGDSLTLAEQYSYWFKFVGWATEPNGQPVYTAGQKITPTGDLQLYAVAEPFSAKVELGAADAEYDRTVIKGELPYSSVILTDFPGRYGYVFTGWMDEDGALYEICENEDGEKYIEITFSCDTTLTAQWEECPHTPGEDGRCANCRGFVVLVKPLPQIVEAEQGETVTVTVEHTGKNVTYTWYYANPGKDTFTKTSAFTGPVYSVAMSESRSGRRIYCVVTDENGFFAKSNVVTLSMAEKRTELAIVKQPVDVSVAAGEKATVTFEAVGDELTYTWYFANPGKETFSKTSAFTSNTYEVTMSADRSGRRIYCVVTDKYGTSLQTDTVTISMPMNVATIVKQPKSVWVKEGEKATVTLEAEGDGLTYKWYYKNPGALKYTYTDAFQGNTYSVTMNESRSGRYVYCKVTDAYGNTVKSKTVSVNMQTPLEIVTPPVSVKAAAGEKATVTVEATGDGLTYKWYYKDPGSEKYKYTDSFTGNSYSITMTEARSGRYVYCKIYDKYGNMVKTGTVSLRMK